MKKIIFLVAVFLAFLSSCEMLGQRRKISLSQSDPRFTIWAESYYNSVNDESIYYYIQNNTNEKYELVVEVTLSSTCKPPATYKLGINKMISLKPNDKFTPKSDWSHIIIGDSKAKECRKKVDNAWTFITSIDYKYLSVKNMTLEEKQKIKK